MVADGDADGDNGAAAACDEAAVEGDEAAAGPAVDAILLAVDVSCKEDRIVRGGDGFECAMAAFALEETPGAGGPLGAFRMQGVQAESEKAATRWRFEERGRVAIVAAAGLKYWMSKEEWEERCECGGGSTKGSWLVRMKMQTQTTD